MKCAIASHAQVDAISIVLVTPSVDPSPKGIGTGARKALQANQTAKVCK